MVEDTLSDKYHQTMARLAKITEVSYDMVIQWECEFDRDILPRHPELKTHPIIQHSPLNTRDALYGGRTEAMRLHYKIREGEETIQYVDVMHFIRSSASMVNFPLVTRLYTWVTRVKT
jgi:hypothetical protein